MSTNNTENKKNIVSKLTFINNRTDVKYIFEAESCYGLGWDYNFSGAICYVHEFTEDPYNDKNFAKHHSHFSKKVAQLKDFSLIKIEKKEFEIKL